MVVDMEMELVYSLQKRVLDVSEDIMLSLDFAAELDWYRHSDLHREIVAPLSYRALLAFCLLPVALLTTAFASRRSSTKSARSFRSRMAGELAGWAALV